MQKKSIESGLPNYLISKCYFWLALNYLKNNESGIALEYFDKSIQNLRFYSDKFVKKESIEWAAHTGKGEIYQKKGLYQLAEEEFKAAEYFRIFRL